MTCDVLICGIHSYHWRVPGSRIARSSSAGYCVVMLLICPAQNCVGLALGSLLVVVYEVAFACSGVLLEWRDAFYICLTDGIYGRTASGYLYIYI